MHRFCFISKRSHFEKFQNIEKFEIFRKKNDFEKGMHSYLFNVGFNRNSLKKAGFNEKPRLL